MRSWACLSIAVVLAAAVAGGQDTPPPVGDKVPVVLDGVELFQVGESGTWSPAQRAREVERILHGAAQGSDDVHLELAEHDGYPTIRMGDWHLLTVSDSDALPGMDPGEQAERWLQTLEAALRRGRAERSSAYLAAAATQIGAAILFAAALHTLLRRASRRLPATLGRWLKLRTRAPYGGRPAWHTTIELGCAAAQVTVWVGIALFACGRLPELRQLRYDAARLLGDGLRAAVFMVNERSVSSLDLLWLLASIALLWTSVSLVVGVVSRRIAYATGTARGAVQPTATLLKYLLLFIGLVVILQSAGLNLSSLAILASVLGVGIGFGLQGIANNFVSGIILSFERPIKPGDFVALGDLRGTVERIGGRSTIISTRDRVSIIVPNSQLLEKELVNWSYGDPVVRLHLPVSVADGTCLGEARAALLEAAQAHPAVLAEPRPEVRFAAFGVNGPDLELLVWSNDPAAQEQVKSDLRYQIDANLRRAAIGGPQPQLQLRLPAEQLDAIVARLRGEASDEPARAADEGPRADAPLPFTPKPWRPIDLDAISTAMRGPDGIAIADRRHLLHTYARCFVGTDAVDWLVRSQECSRDQAVRLGQRLLERGIIHHVLDEQPFRDGNYYYRFYADERAAR